MSYILTVTYMAVECTTFKLESECGKTKPFILPRMKVMFREVK